MAGQEEKMNYGMEIKETDRENHRQGFDPSVIVEGIEFVEGAIFQNRNSGKINEDVLP